MGASSRNGRGSARPQSRASLLGLLDRRDSRFCLRNSAVRVLKRPDPTERKSRKREEKTSSGEAALSLEEGRRVDRKVSLESPTAMSSTSVGDITELLLTSPFSAASTILYDWIREKLHNGEARVNVLREVIGLQSTVSRPPSSTSRLQFSLVWYTKLIMDLLIYCSSRTSSRSSQVSAQSLPPSCRRSLPRTFKLTFLPFSRSLLPTFPPSPSLDPFRTYQ